MKPHNPLKEALKILRRRNNCGGKGCDISTGCELTNKECADRIIEDAEKILRRVVCNGNKS